MVRISFEAGWQAAGGKPPEPQPVIKLISQKPDKYPYTQLNTYRAACSFHKEQAAFSVSASGT
jgi:hypothetical protein